MTECAHKVLVLVPQSAKRKRCIHCHLTISAEELGEGHCPECYEERGLRRYDFEELEILRESKVTYSCESCPLVIECEPREPEQS